MSERSEVSSNGHSTTGYVDVDRITNSDGIVCVISQRRKTGVLTFTMFREYEDSFDGELKRTGFVPESLFQAYLDTVMLAKRHMEELRVGGKLPFPVRAIDAGVRPATTSTRKV
jgi:hypothetical protein